MGSEIDMRNLGYFRIKYSTIKNNIEEVIEIFSLLKVVPIKAELRLDSNEFEYLAISERFERVPAGCTAPDYELRITRSNAGNIELIEVGKI